MSHIWSVIKQHGNIRVLIAPLMSSRSVCMYVSLSVCVCVCVYVCVCLSVCGLLPIKSSLLLASENISIMVVEA